MPSPQTPPRTLSGGCPTTVHHSLPQQQPIFQLYKQVLWGGGEGRGVNLEGSWALHEPDVGVVTKGCSEAFRVEVLRNAVAGPPLPAQPAQPRYQPPTPLLYRATPTPNWCAHAAKWWVGSKA